MPILGQAFLENRLNAVPMNDGIHIVIRAIKISGHGVIATPREIILTIAFEQERFIVGFAGSVGSHRGMNDQFARYFGQRNHVIAQPGKVIIPKAKYDIGGAIGHLQDARVARSSGRRVCGDERLADGIMPRASRGVAFHDADFIIAAREIKIIFAIVPDGVGGPAAVGRFFVVGLFGL